MMQVEMGAEVLLLLLLLLLSLALAHLAHLAHHRGLRLVEVVCLCLRVHLH